MATPMTADQLVKALTDEGLVVNEHKDWRNHNRNHKGDWGPMNGVAIHHTAGSNSLSLCYTGTDALPGPLCHTHLAKDGTATMVGDGRANHAGTFAANAHKAVVDQATTHPRPDATEPVDGNAHYYGIEIENRGDGEDFYPQVQYDAAVKWAAAICRHHGWTADSVIGHKEGTRRKIDPKGPVGKADGPAWDMDEFRKDVAAQLKTQAGKPSTPTKPTTPPKQPAKPAKPPKKPVATVTFPGRGYFRPGAHNRYVTQLGQQLVKRGYGRFYRLGPGPTWTAVDRAAVRAFQRAQGWTGASADGYPGPETWKRLFY